MMRFSVCRARVRHDPGAKPGGAGVKFFQAIKDVNQGCSVTPPVLPPRSSGLRFFWRNGRIKERRDQNENVV